MNFMTDDHFAENNGAYSRALRTRVYFRKCLSGVFILKNNNRFLHFFPIVV